MEHTAHGGAHAHIHRRASEHWSQIRGRKDPTKWIVIGLTAVGAAIALVLYLVLR